MTSFGNPLRPRPGGFLFGTERALPPALGRESTRVALVQPVAGRVRKVGLELEWAASTIVAGTPSTPVTHFRWHVRAFSQARAERHHHFWYEKATPYRDITVELPVGTNFTVSADEADFGYSTWEVKVAPLSISGGTIAFPEVTAFFSIELALSVEPAIDVSGDIVLPASLAEVGSAVTPAAATIEAARAVEPVSVDSARDYDPAIALDPWLVS